MKSTINDLDTLGAAIYITSIWELHALKERYYQEYSMKYINSTSQISKLSLILHTFSITGFVKNARSGLKLFFFPLSFLSSFRFISLYSIFRTRDRIRVTRLHCHTADHIRWHSHKSHDSWKNVEHSERDDVIQCVVHILILKHTHGHLG